MQLLSLPVPGFPSPWFSPGIAFGLGSWGLGEPAPAWGLGLPARAALAGELGLPARPAPGAAGAGRDGRKEAMDRIIREGLIYG